MRGFVLFKDHQFNRQKCSFKPAKDAKTQEFLPSDIAAYGIDGTAAFLSASNASGSLGNIFLEYILQGSPSLLYYGSSYFVESEGEISELLYSVENVQKDGKVFEKKDESFKRQLLDYFKACPDLSAAVLSSRFDSKSLYKLFLSYYECRNIPYQSYIAKGNLVQLKWGAGIKAQRNTLYAKRFAGSTYYFEQSDPVWKPFFSPFLAIHLSYPRLNRRLSLRTGLAFHRFTYTNTEVNDRAGVDLLYEMELQTSHIEIPFVVMYNLNKSSESTFIPYIFAGGGMNFMLNLESERTTTTLTDIRLSRNVLSGRDTYFIGRAGLGATIVLSKGLRLFSEIFVENSSGFAIPDDNDVVINRKALGLSLGTYFK